MEFIPLLLLVISTVAGSNTAANRSSAIEQIIKQAIHTFTTPQDAIHFQANLDDLSQRVKRLTLSEVPAIKGEGVGHKDVSYVQIYDGKNVSIGMFIMKPNSKLPLHNHPLMHGILKVLRGSVRIQSYSHYPDDGIKRKKDLEVCLPSQRYFLDRTSCTSASCGGLLEAGHDTFFACKKAPIILNHTSDCAVLTPVMNNFHEVRAHNGAATFFDILAPPYYSLDAEMGLRKCTYFEEVVGVTKENASGNAGHQCQNVTLKVSYSD